MREYGIEFQSALPRRERLTSMNQTAAQVTFQSALPRRERPGFLPDDMVLGLFQSALPRRERHPEYAGDDIEIQISIRAPAKGATQ